MVAGGPPFPATGIGGPPFVSGAVTYQDYDNLRAMIDAGFVAVHGGRTAHDEEGLRFIAKAEGFDPDAETPEVEDATEIDAASERLRGGSAPTPPETPAGEQTGRESNPDAKDEASTLTPSGLDALTADLKPLKKAQLQEIGTFLGMTDVNGTIPELIVAIEELRRIVAALKASAEGV